MIQRIQSIYLLVAAILMAVTVFSPLGIISAAAVNELLVYMPMGLIDSSKHVLFPTWGVVSIAGLISLLSFVSIFLYKNRKLQLKISYLNIVLIILFYVTMWIYLNVAIKAMSSEFISIQYGIILPIISLIFIILAMLKIKADEKLVQSLNRIR